MKSSTTLVSQELILNYFEPLSRIWANCVPRSSFRAILSTWAGYSQKRLPGAQFELFGASEPDMAKISSRKLILSCFEALSRMRPATILPIGQRPAEQTHGSFEFKHTNPTVYVHGWRKFEEKYWSSRFKHTNSTVVWYSLRKSLGASSFNTQIP